MLGYIHLVMKRIVLILLILFTSFTSQAQLSVKLGDFKYKISNYREQQKVSRHPSKTPKILTDTQNE